MQTRHYRTALSSSAAFAISFLLSSPCESSQAPPVDLKLELYDGLTRKDVSAILNLAEALGIDSPSRLGSYAMLPLPCEYVVVESLVAADGPRLTYRTLDVRRNDPRDRLCNYVGENLVEFDGWVSSSSKMRTVIRWSIEDQGWSTEITLGDQVSYETAVQIVLAVRKNELVNEYPVADELERFSADDITGIEVFMPSANTLEGDTTRTYEVRIQSAEGIGLILKVKIAEGRVELHGISDWIAGLSDNHLPAANERIEQTRPFPSCNNSAGMKVRRLRRASCCRQRAGHAAHSGCSTDVELRT